MPKETRLKSDADIYQKRRTQTKKEELSELSRSEKWQYYKEYYLKYVLFGFLAILFIIALVYSLLKPGEETVLYTAVINDSWDSDTYIAFENDYSDEIQLDLSSQRISFDTSFIFSVNSLDQNSISQKQRLGSYLFNEQVDVIIADQETFEHYAKDGYFLDLADVLPTDLYSQLSNQLFITSIVEEDNENAYGIALKNSTVYNNLSLIETDHYIGIVATTKNKSNAVKLIEYMFDNKETETK